MKIIKVLISMISIIILITQTAYGLPRESNIRLIPSVLQYQLIDPLGRITGYDINTNSIITNIPNTRYILEVEPTGPIEATKYQKSNSILPKVISDSISMTSGVYRIKVFGSTVMPEQFRIGIHTYYQNIKGTQMIANYNSMIYPNTTWTYEFVIPDVPTATGEIILVKVAQPSDLLTDLTTAGQLGYIGSSKFVTELTKEINEIEAEKAKGKIDDGLTPAQKAKKEYTELLSEITEKYNKPESDEFVKKEAYDVLKEDLEYIIGHL